MSGFADFSGVVVLLAGTGTAAAAAARRITERRRARRELRGRPALGTTMQEGTVVKVVGTVRAAGELVEAPLSGRSCVVARSRLLPAWFGMSGKPRRHAIAESLALRPFVLARDGEPDVLVEASHALLDLPALRRLRIEPARRDRFLLLHGYPLQGRHGALEETLVGVGQRVAVVGLMMLEAADRPPAGERGFRDEAPPQLVLTGSRQHPITIGEP